MLILINSSHRNWKVTTTCDLLIQMFSQHVTVSWGFGLCWEAQSNETVSVFIYRHIRMLPQERGAKRCHQRSQLCLNQQHVSISPAGMGVMLRPRGLLFWHPLSHILPRLWDTPLPPPRSSQMTSHHFKGITKGAEWPWILGSCCHSKVGSVSENSIHMFEEILNHLALHFLWPSRKYPLGLKAS